MFRAIAQDDPLSAVRRYCDERIPHVSPAHAFVMGLQMATRHPEWAAVVVADIDSKATAQQRARWEGAMDGLAEQVPLA